MIMEYKVEHNKWEKIEEVAYSSYTLLSFLINSFHYLLKNKILSVFLLKVSLSKSIFHYFDIPLQTQSNHHFLSFLRLQ